MNATLVNAIKKMKMLELRYHGYSRLVEPHAYGCDKDGVEILRCYQTSGGSNSGENVGWKLLKVREALSLHEIETTFSLRRDYKRNDKAMIQFFVQC